MPGHMIGDEKAARTGVHTELGHYTKFAIMVGLSFIAMYFLMFSMIDSMSSFYNNLNMIYMAGLMAAPMAIIEILLMKKMYPNKNLNHASSWVDLSGVSSSGF